MSRALSAFAVVSLTACPGPVTPRTFVVTVSGEAGAVGTTETVDGWELTYDHVLITVGAIGLSENPDRSPTDQSQTGDRVAKLDGPFAVDLAKGGPLDAKEMNGKALKLGEITDAFDLTARYAFGFDLVDASATVQKVNLDSAAEALYATMVTNGWSVLYQGTATFKGTGCRSTDAAYLWDRVPKTVKFTFGWKAPVTYKNCVNPELTPTDTRGVQAQANADTVVQATFHLDHPFWEALEEDAPLRWDAIAARKSVAAGTPPAMVDVTQADLVGVDFQAFKDAQSMNMPLRFCGMAQPGEPTTGALRYDPKSVPVNPAGGAAGLKDLYDYTKYNLATFGHVNNDGLCYPARNYPSP